MAKRVKEFSGSIPEFYDTYMVPLIFEPYAAGLAERVAELAPHSVLETAAGTGVLVRVLTERLGAGARYVVTDLNRPMLEYAESRQAADERITWRQADAQDLPFDDETFDVVICQCGFNFFADRTAGYAEAKRVLSPGGRLIFNTWDRIEENEFPALVTEVAAAVFPDDPPRFLPRIPFGYYDLDVVRRELGRTGFKDITVESVDAISSAPTARHVALAFCHGTPLRNEIEERNAGRLSELTDRVEAVITERYGDGRVSAKLRSHVLTAVN